MTELPPGWTRATLGELALYQNGRGFRKSEWSDTGRPIIRIQNLTGSSGTFNYFQGDVEDRHVVRPGDLLISWAATLGAFIWRGQEGVLNQHIFKVTPFIDREFLYYLVRYTIEDLYRHAHGSGMVHITKDRFDNTPVMVPPMAEQRRIVFTLEEQFSRVYAAQTAINSTREKALRLRQLIDDRAVLGLLVAPSPQDGDGPSLLQSILSRRTSMTSRRRRKPALPAEFGSCIPSHWALASIDQLSWDIEYGSSAKAHTGKSLGDVPVLRMGNIQDGRISAIDLKYLHGDHPDAAKLLLEDGDLLFNRTNSAELVGKSAVYQTSLGRATFASYLIRCRFVPGVSPDWVNLVINSSLGRSYIRQVASQQVGQANVNGSKLARMPIPLPPMAEQQRILDTISEKRDIIARFDVAANSSTSRTEKLSEALLKAALRGQLVPQDPADEPAAVLLGRIRVVRASAVKARRGRRAMQKTVESFQEERTS